MKPWKKSIWFGGDYNPEQWSRQTWQEDLDLMQKAGVTTVTLGVFSWANLEPSEGNYNFDWLDEVMQGLEERELSIDLANATASPPAWVGKKYPDTRFTDQYGIVRSHGGRQNFCPSSGNYRRLAQNLTQQIAMRYGNHPAVAMWHVHNEYACHNSRDYSETSAVAFRKWLRNKYQDSLQELNLVWGTDFWSQRYHDWDEIGTPKITPDGTFPNPTMQLDFARFCSDALLECFVAERDIIRKYSPDKPITTNFMTLKGFNRLDYWKWAAEVDVVSTDHYLAGAEPDRHIELAMQADTTRGLAGGKPWLLMEHSTSAVNWQPRNRAKAPGEMLRNSLQHVARGADGAMFFQWRASVAGSEKFHSALLPHAGQDSKVWREVVQLGASLANLSEVVGSKVSNQVAMIWDYECWWALEQPNLPSMDLNYPNQTYSIYRELWKRNIGVDFIPQPKNAKDLSNYKLVIAPMTYLMDKQAATAIADYVAGGGNLLVSYFSSVSDTNDHVYLDGYLGPLKEVLGVYVEEFAPLLEGQKIKLSNGLEAKLWSEFSRTTSAEVIATFSSPGQEQSVAIGKNRFGEGRAWYLATELEEDGLKWLFSKILSEVNVDEHSKAIPGVEIVRRTSTDNSWLFVINHSAETVSLEADGFELIGQRQTEGRLELQAGSVAVVRESK